MGIYFYLGDFADVICSSLPAYLEDLLVGGLEEAVADAVSVEPPREVFQPQLALEVAAALRRGKSGIMKVIPKPFVDVVYERTCLWPLG